MFEKFELEKVVELWKCLSVWLLRVTNNASRLFTQKEQCIKISTPCSYTNSFLRTSATSYIERKFTGINIQFKLFLLSTLEVTLLH